MRRSRMPVVRVTENLFPIPRGMETEIIDESINQSTDPLRHHSMEVFNIELLFDRRTDFNYAFHVVSAARLLPLFSEPF